MGGAFARIVRVAALALALGRVAGATTAADLCAPGTDPCVVDHSITVDTGSVIDLGSRALQVARTGVLNVGAGTMTINARSVDVVPSGQLLARGGSAGGMITINTTGDIVVERAGSAQARVDLSADMVPGTLTMRAGGMITLAGLVLTRAATTGGHGGTIDVSATGDVAVSGTITATGGAQSAGGSVGLASTQGAVTVDATVDASGGNGGGGGIDIDAASVTITAQLDVSARTGSGDGGAVTVSATGAVALRGPIAAGSACNSTAGCGSAGGDLSIDAGDTILVAAQVDVSGANPDGLAGTIALDAGTDIVQTGQILADGNGAGGCGGDISISAARNLTLGPIDLSGGFCGGGSLDASSTASLAATGEINGDSRSSGPGGDLALAGQGVSIGAALHANGPTLRGGTLTIDGCSIDVPAGVQLSTRGDMGSTILSASGAMTIGGSLLSGTGTSGTGGLNRLRYRDPAMPPAIAGTATFVPPPDVVNDPTLPTCRGVLPPGCGNGQLDPGEECDDMNTTSCDGCSSDCLLEGCGNGRTECDEECDDHNTTACDGCSASCHVERCGNGVVECTEECDDGAANGTPASACDANCHLGPPPGCGDGNRGPNEECDDGNTTDCDGCSHLCQVEQCGNGTRECAEECDDGNLVPGDGCRPNCTREVCGDGIKDPEEECDDGPGNGLPGATCDTTCHAATLCGIVTTEPPCVPCVSDRACDPLGRCAGRACIDGVCTVVDALDCADGRPGTIDRCELDDAGAPRCVHTCFNDHGCDDGDPCNGLESCAAGSCVPGAAAACDDGDPCTDDGCESGRGCLHVARTGLPGVACRIDAMQGALAAAPEEQVPARIAQRTGKHLGRLRTWIDAATAAEGAGDGRRERRALRRATLELLRIGNIVGRARGRGQMDQTLADVLVTALTGAYQTVTALQATLG